MRCGRLYTPNLLDGRCVIGYHSVALCQDAPLGSKHCACVAAPRRMLPAVQRPWQRAVQAALARGMLCNTPPHTHTLSPHPFHQMAKCSLQACLPGACPVGPAPACFIRCQDKLQTP